MIYCYANCIIYYYANILYKCTTFFNNYIMYYYTNFFLRIIILSGERNHHFGEFKLQCKCTREMRESPCLFVTMERSQVHFPCIHIGIFLFIYDEQPYGHLLFEHRKIKITLARFSPCFFNTSYSRALIRHRKFNASTIAPICFSPFTSRLR